MGVLYWKSLENGANFYIIFIIMKRLPHAWVVMWVVLIVGAYLVIAYKVGQVPDIPELITCEERYIGDTYWGEVKYRDGEFIYLDGYHSIDTICALDKSQVEEWYPLCGTQIEFKWPLDTSNMNCYEEWNPKSITKAFKKQIEDERKEDERYYACNLDSNEMVRLYNGCETTDCARHRIREYLKEVCPRASLD